MRYIGNCDALVSLRPDASFEMLSDEYENLVWHTPDITIPTKEEMIAEKARLEQVERDNLYKSERAAEYPSFGDQLDMLFHAMEADETKRLEPFYTTIKTIKDAHPKP